MELQQYDFKVIHRAKKSNANADALFRILEEDNKSSEGSGYFEEEVSDEALE